MAMVVVEEVGGAVATVTSGAALVAEVAKYKSPTCTQPDTLKRAAQCRQRVPARMWPAQAHRRHRIGIHFHRQASIELPEQEEGLVAHLAVAAVQVASTLPCRRLPWVPSRH